jgi:translation elongation factor EF-Tu-like GTPase
MERNSEQIKVIEKYIEENNLRTKYKDLDFDVQAEVTYIRTEKGGRQGPALSGYRPAHKVRDDYLTTGLHVYIEVDMAWPGDTVLADIKFISPEHYPSCLWIGKIINIQEGSRTVGHAKIMKIYNNTLEKTSQQKH